MKKLNHFFLIILTLAGMLGCQKDPLGPDDIKSNVKLLNIDTLEQKILAAYTGKSVGMQYMIAQNGILVKQNAIGMARLDVNYPAMEYTTTHRNGVHSVSKTLTAIGLVSVLEEYNISIDDWIYPYLPSDWYVHDEVFNITFRELLTHMSGLRGTEDTYAEMKDYMCDSTFGTKTYSYANINFTLCRIIIPFIVAHEDMEYYILSGHADELPLVTANIYIEEMRNRVFIPAQIDPDIDMKIWDQDMAGGDAHAVCCYDYTNQAVAGSPHPDCTLIGGAGGWYMNSAELGSVLSYFFAGLLPGVDADLLIDNQLGMYDITLSGHRLFTHNGGSNSSLAVWMHVEKEDVDIVFMFNSDKNDFDFGQIEEDVMQMYDESFL
ncbi:MAG: serine hydrolase domain-containing protein [Chitinophagales bacterium]